jgi:hypothetical protein
MATGSIKVNVVDVGQGQCTFVEIYDTADKLTNTLLFDCGSDSKSDFTLVNLKYIAAKVNSMTTPAFDLLSFSHSDNDHISLMWDLLQYCLPTKPTIKKLVYGGNRNLYTKRSFNIITYLVNAKYCAESVISTPAPDSSGFDKAKAVFGTPLWESADKAVRVDLLVGNVISSEEDDIDIDDPLDELPALKGAEALNRVSLICRVFYNGLDYVICGDATNQTMGIMNWYFAGRRFANVPMLTLPHHGSRATGLAVGKNYIANDHAVNCVKTFAKICRGRTITVSSYHKHGHPSMELVTYFTTYLETKPRVKDAKYSGNEHSMVSYVDLDLTFPDTSDVDTYAYTTYFTLTNLYGTFYYNPWDPTHFGYSYVGLGVETAAAWTGAPFNAHACWVYSANSIKTESLVGAASLPVTLATQFTTAATATSVSAVEPTVVALAPPSPVLKGSLRMPARLRTFR